MRRRYRVVLSVAATAGLIGGVGAAVGAVPGAPPAPQAPGAAAVSFGASAPAAEGAEVGWLKANLARTSGDGTYLRARIAGLESDVVRARKSRAQRVRAQRVRAQQLRALELRQQAQELSRQRAVLAQEQQASVSQASYVAPKPAPRLTGYAPVRRASTVRAIRSPAPRTHARTGASGAPTSSTEDKEDSHPESGESDHGDGGSDD